MGHAVMIMMYCGLRRGELLALTWKDINLEKKVLSVNKSVHMFKNQSQVKKPNPKREHGKSQYPISLCMLYMISHVIVRWFA
jgi:integrase